MLYVNGGATVEIVECYRGHDRGGGFFLVKLRRTSPYYDGSGADSVGEIMHEDDRTAKGWSAASTLEPTADCQK